MNQYHDHKTEAQKGAGHAYDNFIKHMTHKLEPEKISWLTKIKKFFGIIK